MMRSALEPFSLRDEERGTHVVRTVVVALGSNVGDRAAHLQFGIERLGSLLEDFVVSRFIETEPERVGPQPRYLNAVTVGQSPLPAPTLLAELQAIEHARGRERPYPGAPRTLDLDLILVGDEVISSSGLELPHPRFRRRRFVLEPLVEIAPGLVDPVSGWSVRRLLETLDREP